MQTGSLTRQILRNFSRPDPCIDKITRDKHSPAWKLSYAAVIEMSRSAQCASEGISNEIFKLADHRGCFHWPQPSLQILALGIRRPSGSQAAHIPRACVKAGAVLLLYGQPFSSRYLSTLKLALRLQRIESKISLSRSKPTSFHSRQNREH